jgi:hypothetical protein
MDEERRRVLERVASGELSPAEGAALLEQMEAGGGTTGNGTPPRDDPRDWTADWAEPGPEPASGTYAPTATLGRASRIRVLSTINVADIIGDPSVSEAVAEGPHVARREGDALIIEAEDHGWWTPGFYFDWRGGDWGGRGRWRHQPGPVRRHHRGPRGWQDMNPLRVRVNPDLPLEVEAQAGKLRIRGVHGPIRANGQAGSTEIDDFRGPLDLSVQAGSVRARGRLDHGASQIRCQAGGVRIDLERGSSVRVSAHATLGKVVFDHEDARSGVPWVIGNGEATLDIDATMGSVRVTADR